MLDATPKMPVGLLSYSIAQLGNFEECTEIHSQKYNITGQYCLGRFSLNSSTLDYSSEYWSNRFYLKFLLKEIYFGLPEIRIFSWAVCLPSNCTSSDVMEIMHMTDNFGLKTSFASCQTKSNTINNEAIVGIVLFSIPFILVIISTIVDVYSLYTKKTKVFTVFSVYTNGKALFKVPKRTTTVLSCLDGMRVISMLWIMLHHVNFIYTLGPAVNSVDVIRISDSIVSLLFFNGNLACDTFLLIGGTLVTYVYFKNGKKQKLTPTVILKHYLHRYIRLTPTVAGLVLFYVTLLKYSGSGPIWDRIDEHFVNPCKRDWWTALLYVQNEVSDLKCMGYTWYLNVDMQLYILSPLIFFFLNNYSKIGIGVLLLASLSSMTLSFYRAYIYKIFALESHLHFGSHDNFWYTYYYATETRASTWLLGTILGYLLSKKGCTTVKIPKKYSVLWMITISVILVCILGGQDTLRGEYYDRILNSVHIALVRPTFAIAVGWMVWACATNNAGIINTFLSHGIFQFFNKFTYNMYLLHPVFLTVLVFSNKTAIYFNIFNILFWYSGVVMFVFGLSIIWMLLVESPVLALEKIILSHENGHT